MHLSIEVLIDIGNQIVLDDNLGRFDIYKDIDRILAENDYISEKIIYFD